MPGANPVQNVSGEHLLLLLGDGKGPETFTASATINTTRSLDISVKASTTEIADTENPSLPANTVRQAVSTDLKFTGAGVADAPSYLQIANWTNSGQILDARIMLGLTGAQGGFTATGKLLITSCNLSGAARESATFTATFEQAAPFVFAPNA
jgi:hypothetical protein